MLAKNLIKVSKSKSKFEIKKKKICKIFNYKKKTKLKAKWRKQARLQILRDAWRLRFNGMSNNGLSKRWSNFSKKQLSINLKLLFHSWKIN